MVLKQSTRRKQEYCIVLYMYIVLLTKNIGEKANQYSHKRRSIQVNKSHSHIIYKVIMHFILLKELPIAGYLPMFSQSNRSACKSTVNPVVKSPGRGPSVDDLRSSS